MSHDPAANRVVWGRDHPAPQTPKLSWSGRPDLNRRHPAPKAGALPTALRPVSRRKRRKERHDSRKSASAHGGTRRSSYPAGSRPDAPKTVRPAGPTAQEVSRNRGGPRRLGSVPTMGEGAMPTAMEGNITLTPWPLSPRERGGSCQRSPRLLSPLSLRERGRG